MDLQDDRPPMTGVTAYLMPSSVAEAKEFYKTAFAASEVFAMPSEDGKRFMHCHLRINDGDLMMSDAFPEAGYPAETPAAITLHLQVDDADLWFNRAVEAGATIAMPLDNQFWGDRYGQVVDPFGYRWSIGGPKKD